MARIVVLGGGIAGVSCAYELMHAVRKEDRVTLVSNKPFFQFTPSNPWVAVKWRSKDDVTIDLAGVLPRHGIAFSAAGAARLHPAENRLELEDGPLRGVRLSGDRNRPRARVRRGRGPGTEGPHAVDLPRGSRGDGGHGIGNSSSRARGGRHGRDAGRVLLRPGLRVCVDHGHRPPERRRSATRCPSPCDLRARTSDTWAWAESATPRESWRARCATATSSGSPTPRSPGRGGQDVRHRARRDGHSRSSAETSCPSSIR